LKPVVLSPHASDYLAKRGTNLGEIAEAIESSEWEPARDGRLECRKNFPYESDWAGRHYATKQVRPIFVEEPDQIVVVTVYVYYF
jgi:hypothetical protein